MAEVVLFHHAQGLTPGLTALAEQLRQAGHAVHTPDLYEGSTFATLTDGMAHFQSLGSDELDVRADRAVSELPAELVYAGISLGVMPAQRLAQTRPGARGALLLESCVDPSYFGGWPDGVPVQVHGMDADPIFAGEGDVEAARELVASVADGELFLYPGDRHLFSDSTLEAYSADATALLVRRLLAFLNR
jgi:dienelactone hydrolase